MAESLTDDGARRLGSAVELPVQAAGAVSARSSRRTSRNDLIKKKRVYHRHQVPHYWIIDPEQETLAVYRWAQDGCVEILAAERGEQVQAEPFDAIPLQIGVLFGDDEDDEPARET